MKKMLLLSGAIALAAFTGLASASPPQGIGVGDLVANNDTALVRDVGSGGVIAAVPIADNSAFVKTILHDDGSSSMKSEPTWVMLRIPDGDGLIDDAGAANPAKNLGVIALCDDEYYLKTKDGEVGWVAGAQIKQENSAAIIT